MVRCCPRRSFEERRASWTNGLPIGLVAAFSLIAWNESFPITAYTSLVRDDLRMNLSTISTYYSVCYMPWMWKPVYGWISDNFPLFGFHRLPYIILTSIGCAAAFLVTATSVYSAEALFLVTFCRAVCNSFLQFMVSAFLVDVARQDVSNSAGLQSTANAAQWFGTFAAQCMALVLYIPSSDGATKSLLGIRGAIALSALGPICLACIAFTFRERPVDRVTAASERIGWTCSRKEYQFGGLILLLQANLVVVGCQHLLDFTTWWHALLFFGAMSLCIIAVVSSWSQCSTAQRGQEVVGRYRSQHSEIWKWCGLCVFCFSANAIPTSGVAVGQLQYAVFSPQSYQVLQIVSSVSSLFASLMFGRGFNRSNLRLVFVVATLIAVVAAFAPLPFVARAGSAATKHTLWSTVGALGVSATIFSGLTGQFTVLPVDTLITTASGSLSAQRSSTAYAVLLAFYNMGATASGLIASPILDAMHLDGVHWESMPEWMLTTAGLKLLIFPFFALLPRDASNSEASREDVDVSLEEHLADERPHHANATEHACERGARAL